MNIILLISLIILLISLIFIVALTIVYFFISTNYKPRREVYIDTIVKSKQIIKQPYKSPAGQPKPSVVPMKLFQTWHTKNLPPKMQENVQNIKKQNPELEYFLFDESDCADFIKSHFSEDVLVAYKKLLPCSYKSDLWRFCAMYIHGGVYLDIKYHCVDGFKFIDIMDREHFVLERPGYWEPEKYGIYTALIIANPGNQIFLNCIHRIVRNTQTNYYGYNALYPTGPGLLGELYFGNIADNMHMLDNFDLVFNMVNDQEVIIYKNQIILRCYPEYRMEQRANQKRKHYGDLWGEHAIYTRNKN